MQALCRSPLTYHMMSLKSLSSQGSMCVYVSTLSHAFLYIHSISAFLCNKVYLCAVVQRFNFELYIVHSYYSKKKKRLIKNPRMHSKIALYECIVSGFFTHCSEMNKFVCILLEPVCLLFVKLTYVKSTAAYQMCSFLYVQQHYLVLFPSSIKW